MSKEFVINNPFFRFFAPAATGVFAYLLILLLNNDIGSLPEIFIGQEVYVCIVLTYFLSESQRLLINYFHRNGKQRSSTQLVFQLINGLLISIAITTAALMLYFHWFLKFSVSESQIVIFNITYSLLGILYHLLFISNYYFFLQNNEQLDLEMQLKEDLTRHMQNYRNRVNPELLYHSLETLITLIHKNVHEAEDFIDHLSAVYRHILANRHNELVTLQEEINATSHILYLLNHEYNNLVFFNKNLTENPESIYILPGTLTVLIEHVVRNNIITPISPIRIELSDEPRDGYLVLKNTLNERLYQDGSFDQHFNALQGAYNFYSEKPLIRVKAHTDNFLKLPLLKELHFKEAIPLL